MSHNPLLIYILDHSALSPKRTSRVLGIGLWVLGQLGVLLAALLGRDWVESIPVCVGYFFCPIALLLPLASALLAGTTYERFAPQIRQDEALQLTLTSDRQIIHGLWRGTFDPIRPIPALVAATSAIMATSLAFDVRFWDSAAGSYGPPPPPLSSYTTADYVMNAAFWYLFFVCLVGLNGTSALLSLWLCIRWRTILGSFIASFLTGIIIVGLGILFLWLGGEYDYFVAGMGACGLPILTLTLLAYGAAHASLRRNRFY